MPIRESEQELKRKQASLIDFETIAGEDNEIDHLELKALLDRSFRAGTMVIILLHWNLNPVSSVILPFCSSSLKVDINREYFA